MSSRENIKLIFTVPHSINDAENPRILSACKWRTRGCAKSSECWQRVLCFSFRNNNNYGEAFHDLCQHRSMRIKAENQSKLAATMFGKKAKRRREKWRRKKYKLIPLFASCSSSYTNNNTLLLSIAVFLTQFSFLWQNNSIMSSF